MADRRLALSRLEETHQSCCRLQKDVHVGGDFDVGSQSFQMNSFRCVHAERASGGLQPKDDTVTHPSIRSRRYYEGEGSPQILEELRSEQGNLH